VLFVFEDDEIPKGVVQVQVLALVTGHVFNS